jgi:predicted Ser/Thr protein kinase
VARKTRSRPPAAEPDRDTSKEAAALLGRFGEEAARSFTERRPILSFAEYLAQALAEPVRHLRDAAGYLRDAFEHYGRYEVDRPWGKIERFGLFDVPFGDGRERLVGHEAAAREFHRVLSGFVRDGRPNRLVLLHGPNGSAKTTFVQCIIRAMEDYSSTDEGLLYRFHWVFPSERLTRGGLGFGGGAPGSKAAIGSFAHLEDADIDARLVCEMRDHPLLLLPAGYRREVLARMVQTHPSLEVPDLLARSGLCHKCKQIFDALLASYQGDLARVLRHVQVERYTVSRGYRRGAIVIGPQLSVDASERQVTMDRSLGALPTALQNMALYEPHGELVDAAGGLVVFDDLLKRPLDTFKYLLTTIENGEVTLGHSILRVNAVMVATSNEVHLEAFRRHPEYPSFRGRLATLRVPYLREHPLEREIYELQIVPHLDRHVAPNAVETAARWAVMTRLLRPDPEGAADEARGLVRDLTVGRKAGLYAGEIALENLEPEETRVLQSALPDLRKAGEDASPYEGLVGASPREIRSVLVLAAQRPESPCLTAFGVLAEIEALCEHKSDYAFLQIEPEPGGYHDVAAIRETLRTLLLDRTEEDLRAASGLVDERQFPEMVTRYVREVRHWVNGEKLRDGATGQERAADEAFMRETEAFGGVGADAAGFRNELMTRAGAWLASNPGKPLEVPVLFSDLVRRVRRAAMRTHRPQVFRLAERLLVHLDDPEAVPKDDRPRVAAMRETLLEKRGYCPDCLREAVGRLIRERRHEIAG